MKLLTDSYAQFSEESVAFSGKVIGGPAIAAETLKEIPTAANGLDVEMVPISDAIKKKVCDTFGIEWKDTEDSYILDIDDKISIYADNERGFLFGAYSVLGHSLKGLKKGLVYSTPCVGHRSVHCYLPAVEDLPFFYRFIDLLLYTGYNALILEIDGALEFKSHPEINEYWLKYAKSVQEYNSKPYVMSSIGTRVRNAVHSSWTANGTVVPQQAMRDFTAYCKERYIEVIPEVPALSHSDYILGCHPEFAECQDELSPDTACPQNDKFYDLVFDLYDEVIDVFDAKTVHIGHDEWWVICQCEKCKDKNPADLYSASVNRCHNYLKSKGVQSMMWGEKFLHIQDRNGEYHCAAYKKTWAVPTYSKIDIVGKKIDLYERLWYVPDESVLPDNAIPFEIPAVDNLLELIDPDVQVLNWSYSLVPEPVDPILRSGRWMSYGNFRPSTVRCWKERVAGGLNGISFSNWYRNNQEETQRYHIMEDIAYGTYQVWNLDSYDEDRLFDNLLYTSRELYRFYNRKALQGNHVKIVHAAATAFCPNKDSDFNYDATIMGNYVVTYKDGSTEKTPVYLDYNIGPFDDCKEVVESTIAYNIVSCLDRAGLTFSSCELIDDPQGIYYRIDIPTKGNVESVHFEPCARGRNIKIKRIEIIEK